MPTAAQKTLLCRYHYDPLDRLVDCSPINQASLQRFYCKSRLASEIQGATQTSIFQHDEQLLAEQRRHGSNLDTHLLATDAHRSVLQSLSPGQRQSSAYAPYGHRTAGNGVLSLLGFNGERADPLTGHYLLGNSYRAFNPVLMRFNSPDSLSPFEEGGLNSYAYCLGDPVNRQDPTGHIPMFPRGLKPRLPTPPGSPPPLPPRSNRLPHSQDTSSRPPPLPPRNGSSQVPPRTTSTTSGPTDPSWPPGAIKTGDNTLMVPVSGDPERVMFYSISGKNWPPHQPTPPASISNRQPSPGSRAPSSTRTNPLVPQPTKRPETPPPDYNSVVSRLDPGPEYNRALFEQVSDKLKDIRRF